MTKKLTYGGQIESFPEVVINKMLYYQKQQTGAENIEVFEKRCYAEARGFDWDKTPEKYEFWNKVINNKNFSEFFEKFNTCWSLNDLLFGRVALFNDGKVEDLRKVLSYVFPNDHSSIEGSWTFYAKHKKTDDKWDCYSEVPLPTQSLSKFIEQLPDNKIWTLEDLRLGRVALINNGTLEELRKVLKLAFPNSARTAGLSKFYTGGLETWIDCNATLLPKQSVSIFIQNISNDIIVLCKSLYQWRTVLNLLGNPRKLVDEQFQRLGEAYITVFSSNPDFFGTYSDISLSLHNRVVLSYDEWALKNLNQKTNQYNIMEIKKSDLVGLYNADNCSEWRNVIKQYLIDNFLRSDEELITISENHIQTLFQKGSAKQKDLVKKVGINPFVDLSKLEPGLYYVTDSLREDAQTYLCYISRHNIAFLDEHETTIGLAKDLNILSATPVNIHEN
jgi:hypothetical protein